MVLVCAAVVQPLLLSSACRLYALPLVHPLLWLSCPPCLRSALSVAIFDEISVDLLLFSFSFPSAVASSLESTFAQFQILSLEPLSARVYKINII